jgi:NAD(P)-dependent dehydrogenase (short-subunit alcohol dehydrogenase family)
MQLDGKVAAITGGTQGIGLGIAKAFVAEGAIVSLMGRNPENGDKALAELGAGDRATFYSGSVKEVEGLDGFVADTVARHGRVDIMVNNAGGGDGLTVPLVDVTDEVWDDTIKWNLYSTFWGMRAALRDMITRQNGRIINISSVEGKHGKPILSTYVAAKHAVNGLTKSVAKEYGTQGITVNSICPGLVITEIIKREGPGSAAGMGLTFDGMIELFAAESAIKRPNTVEEVAAVAVLLASDVAAGITGANYSVDGGTAAY